MPRRKRTRRHEKVKTVITSEQNVENPNSSYLSRGQYTLTETSPQFSHSYDSSYFDWGGPPSNVHVNALSSAPSYIWPGMEAINAAVPAPAYANYLYQADYFHQPQGPCLDSFAIPNTLYGLQFQPIQTFPLYNPAYFIGQTYRTLPGPIFFLDAQRPRRLDNCGAVTNPRQDTQFAVEAQNNIQDNSNKKFKETVETENETPYLVEEPETEEDS